MDHPDAERRGCLFGEYQVLDKDKLFYVCPVVKFLTHRSFLS